MLAAWFENPFIMLKMPLPRLSRSGVFVLPGEGPEAAGFARPNGRPDRSQSGRIAKLADASAGA